MKRDYIIMLIIVILFISIITITKIFNKNSPVSEELTTVELVTSTSGTTTTTTKKTTKKTVKTTHKTTKVHKVNTSGKQDYINYAKQVSGYDDTQMNCLINLWDRESNWNPNAVNKSSGACGIPQALPCSKIKKQQGSNDWNAQIRWGINYINYRYKSPCSAWNHFKKKNWY